MISPVPCSASNHLTQALQRLRCCSQQSIQSAWHWQLGDVPHETVLQSPLPQSWPIAPLNQRQHIAWAKGQQVLWLYQQIVVPAALHGYSLDGLTLRLALTWWAEDAQIFIDGSLVQAGDLFDCFTRLCLGSAVTAGETFEVAIRLISPGHDAGALVRSHLCYEAPARLGLPSPEPGFVADELEVLQHYAQTLAPERLSAIEQAIAAIDWSALAKGQTAPQSASGGEQRWAFHQSLAQVRSQLQSHGDWVKQRQLHCLGHAHLDLAWLWPVADTWQAAERTFQSVLNLQQDFPELTYTHSSPALFDWLEQHRPALFQAVQQKVKEGTWGIDAGLWVEPELNIVSGESIARQILYGQRYCQAKFGSISKIAWLPDTFGFCNQLPQLLQLGGIEVFATQKLRWNDTNPFPHELFLWQALDGSEVLGWTLPPIGTDFDPIQIAQYAASWENQTGLGQALWLPGVGDHGGGPSRDMLERSRRWAASPFFPKVRFSSAIGFLEAALPTQTELPVWSDELYLELHRGCYTTHADQKQANRHGEALLYQAELWSSIAQIVARHSYPKAALAQAWKTLLFNQFHDILPGSAVPEVFVDANQGWAAVKQSGQQAVDEALDAIAAHISWPSPPHPDAKPLLVFNALSWERSEVVTYSVPKSARQKPQTGWQLCDLAGQSVPLQAQTVRQ
ncbi:MAG: alpha-mannosidase, partial [Leptolyngbya sp. SIO4C1]|nr:alpha-mannosidase [Leptolyngbya sp. SIO4C1]